MKCNPIILALFCGVSSVSVQVHTRDEVEKLNLTNSVYLERHKRQDDRRNWGYVVVTEHTQDDRQNWGYVVVTEHTRNNHVQRTTNNPVTEADPNPCLNVYKPTQPDFSGPGRRTSDIKCYEYIWDIKVRYENQKQAAVCAADKHRDPFKPHYAIGGRDTTLGEFPHMGAIGWKATVGTWIFKCGSTLISPKFVLTAAHCSSASTRDTTIADTVPKIVRLGDKNINDVYENGVSPTDANITKIIVHPKYASPKKYYDIALMELEKEVVFTKHVQPACLWTHLDTRSLGSKATLTGWGVVESGGRNISPELQAAIVDIIDSDRCDQLLRPSCYRNWCGVQEHQVCAGKLTGGVDACEGDSGGPLQVKVPLPIAIQGTMYYVIGVTSFGIGCALENLPGIYTRVSSFIDWIENNVWR